MLAKNDIRITARNLRKKISNVKQTTIRIPIPVNEFERKRVARIKIESCGGGKFLS